MMRRSLKLLALSSASLALVAATPCLGAESTASKVAQTVELAITSEGTVPATVVAKSGQPMKLIITRKTDSTCVQQVVMKDFGVDKPLPLNTPVAVEVTPAKKGTYRLQCGMGMTFASLKVE
jgi:plastocyanin domain-containing protein